MKGLIEDFGQQTGHTCALACLRFLLWQHSINHSESDLLTPKGKICNNPDGFTSAQIAAAIVTLGFVPVLRCLSGLEWMIGHCPSGWIKASGKRDMESWLRGNVKEGTYVMVSLDLNYLGSPYEPDRVRAQLHSVVVIGIEENRVSYLEPDDPNQASYPKKGRLMHCDWEKFKNAWENVGYIATLLNKEGTAC